MGVVFHSRPTQDSATRTIPFIHIIGATGLDKAPWNSGAACEETLQPARLIILHGDVVHDLDQAG